MKPEDDTKKKLCRVLIEEVGRDFILPHFAPRPKIFLLKKF